VRASSRWSRAKAREPSVSQRIGECLRRSESVGGSFANACSTAIATFGGTLA
jgi:hypothetical protein